MEGGRLNQHITKGQSMKIRVAMVIVLACGMGVPAMGQGTTKLTPSAVKPVAPVKAAAPAEQPVTKPADKKPADAAMPGDDEMAAWMATAMPGVYHEHLQKMAGEWETTMKAGWGGKMEESKGTLKNNMRMGGRYLVSNYSGTMMGQPMVGQGVMGYNNITKQYETTWRDNMGTGMMIEMGTCDAAGKVITTKGQMQGPDGQMMKQRTVYTIGDGKYTIEAFSAGADGQEAKVFELTCVRTKAPGKAAAGEDDLDEMQEQVKKKVKSATDALKPK